MSRLDALRAAGVSIWLDDLSRELLERIERELRKCDADHRVTPASGSVGAV